VIRDIYIIIRVLQTSIKNNVLSTMSNTFEIVVLFRKLYQYVNITSNSFVDILLYVSVVFFSVNGGCNGDRNAMVQDQVLPNPSTCAMPQQQFASVDDLTIACVCKAGYVLSKPGGKCIKLDCCPGKTKSIIILIPARNNIVTHCLTQ
jgi:hypothetical protein